MSRPFIPVAHTASCELIYSNAGNLFENTLHVESNTDWTLTDLRTLRDVMKQWWIDSYKLLNVASTSLIRIRTKALHAADAPMEDYSVSPVITGTQALQVLPLNVAFCFKLASDQAGRSQRGRWYVGGLNLNSTLSNQLVGSSASSYATSLNLLFTRIPAANANWKIVITSYRTDKAWRAAGHNTPATGFTYVDLYLDSQRRRLTGRGHS